MGRGHAAPPTPAVRWLARHSVPISVVAGLLALSGAVLLVVNIVTGGSVWSIFSSVAMMGFWGRIAYGVGVELRRNVRAWDVALSESIADSDHDSKSHPRS